MEYVKKFVVKGTIFEGQSSSSTVLKISQTTTQIVNSTFNSNRIGNFISLWMTGESFII